MSPSQKKLHRFMNSMLKRLKFSLKNFKTLLSRCYRPLIFRKIGGKRLINKEKSKFSRNCDRWNVKRTKFFFLGVPFAVIFKRKTVEQMNNHLKDWRRLIEMFRLQNNGLWCLLNFLFEMTIFILQFPRWNSFFLSSIKFRSHRNTENAFRLRIRICKLYSVVTF